MTYIKEDIKKLATKMFGDTDKAEEWLTTSIKVLNNRAPASRLVNDEGQEEVSGLPRHC